MKLEKPVNSNYAGVIVEVKSITPLANCDNVVGVPLFGLQAIVSKDVKVGDVGIFFPAETQLSDEFCAANNLYRHAERNSDPQQSGYFEDNRRIKAVKFRGHRSDAFFIPLTSLDYLNKHKGIVDPTEFFSVGDTFDLIGTHEICRKYVNKIPGVQRIDKNASKKFVRVESKFIPEHYDTDNYWRNENAIEPHVSIVVTQKLHGTSIRLGNTVVQRELRLRDRLAQRLGIAVATTEYAHVYGSRKVIKDANNPRQDHFYDYDLWSTVGKRYDDLIPENFLVYGEVIGWASEDSPIQQGYTYDLPKGENELYVYRVAVITSAGRVVDLTWDQVVNFCDEQGFKHVPELWRGRKEDFDVDLYVDANFYNDWSDNEDGSFREVPIRLSNAKTVDEGVVVRAEGRAPYLLKAKSPIFLQAESSWLDKQVRDIEAEESVVEDV